MALHLGHRESIDFDFFTPYGFNPDSLFIEFQKIFKGFKLDIVQNDVNTLTIIVDSMIKVSFFAYPYKVIEPLIDEPNLRLASILDIACMKCSAIVNRAKFKDYVDLYFILHLIPLDKLVESVKIKLSSLDINLVMKSLIYLSDLDEEPIKFRQGKEVERSEVEKFLMGQVKNLQILPK